jgi:hypothetical protein
MSINNLRNWILPTCAVVCAGAILSAAQDPEVYEEHKNLIFAAGAAAVGAIAATAANWTWRLIRPHIVIGGAVDAHHVAALRMLNAANLLSQPNIDALRTNVQHAQRLGQGFEVLNRAGLLTQRNIDALIANSRQEWNLVHGLACLYNVDILNQRNIDALIENAQDGLGLVSGLISLNDSGLQTQANFDRLITNAQHALELANGFKALKRVNFLTELSINALFANSQHAHDLGQGFEVLNRAGLLTQLNIDALIANPQHALELARGFEILNNAGLLTQPTRDALSASAQHAVAFANGFEALRRAGLLRAENLQHEFADHPQIFVINAEDVAAHSRAALLQYVEIVQQNRGALPRIQYQDNPAVDAGGITRDFISKLFKSIFTNPETFPVVNTGNGLLLKIAQQENIESVKAMGTIFAAALANKRFTTGKYVDPMIFEMILSLEKADLERIPENLEGLPKNILDKLAARYITSQYPNGLGGMSNDQFLHDYPEATQVVHAAAALAKSMYTHLGEQGWAREVTGKTANDLTGAIQGSISREIIIAAIRRTDANQVAVNLLEGWLNQANENQLKQFLIAVTGSATLLPNQTLTVNQTTLQALRGGTFAFHTCFYSIDVAVNQNPQAFTDALNAAIEGDGFSIE